MLAKLYRGERIGLDEQSARGRTSRASAAMVIAAASSNATIP
jgi:hypothetical protein